MKLQEINISEIDFLKALTDRTSQAGLISNITENKVLHYNQKFLELIGKENAQLIDGYSEITDFFGPDSIIQIQESLNQYDGATSSFPIISIIQLADSFPEPLQMALRLKPYKFSKSDSLIVEFTCAKNCVDLFQNKKIILDNLDQGLIVSDFNLNIVFANPRIASLLEYTNDELLELGLQEIFQADSFKKFAKELKNIRHKDKTNTKNYQLESRSGVKIDISVHAIHTLDGIIFFFQDRTDIKLMGEFLMKESAVNQAISDVSQLAIQPSMTNSDFAREIFNSIQQIVGCDGFAILDKKKIKSSVIFSNIDETYLNSIQKKLNKIRDHYIANSVENDELGLIITPISNLVVVNISDSEQRFGFMLVSNKKTGFSSEDTQILLKFRNILTTYYVRKSYEQDLIGAKEKAEESERLKSVFLDNMSHELRTPMNAIMGFSEIIKYQHFDDEASKHKYLDYIKENTSRLMSLVEDIILYSKIETNQITANSTEFNVGDLFTSIGRKARKQLDKSGKEDIKLVINNDLNSENLVVVSDKEKLERVLLTLVDNAIKFTESGSIECGFEINSPKRLLYVFVKDTGIGISKAKLPYIFDKFRQGDDSYTRKYGGIGIGLSITKRLVDILGGILKVESQRGKGSIFFFDLPIGLSKPEKADTAVDWSDKHVLIVEDEEANFQLFKAILILTRINILYAETGQQAVDMVKEYPEIDIVLMDIKMPIMDGYEATQQIRSFNKDIPILAQTAHAYVQDQQKAIDAGCNDFILKPINRKQLITKMNTYLDR